MTMMDKCSVSSLLFSGFLEETKLLPSYDKAFEPPRMAWTLSNNCSLEFSKLATLVEELNRLFQ